MKKTYCFLVAELAPRPLIDPGEFATEQAFQDAKTDAGVKASAAYRVRKALEDMGYTASIEGNRRVMVEATAGKLSEVKAAVT